MILPALLLTLDKYSSWRVGSVMQFNMKLLFQLRELLLKIQYCLIKVILIFNLQFILY